MSCPGSPRFPLPSYRPSIKHDQGLAAMLTLLISRADRLPTFSNVDCGKESSWLRSWSGSSLALEQAEAARLALTSTTRY